jgi:hypothetical protein
MIPRIKHSRSQLQFHLNEYEDGAATLFVSSDTYPDLFSFQFPAIAAKAPKGWSQKKMAYLWFPAGALSEEDTESISGRLLPFLRSRLPDRSKRSVSFGVFRREKTWGAVY